MLNPKSTNLEMKLMAHASLLFKNRRDKSFWCWSIPAPTLYLQHYDLDVLASITAVRFVLFFKAHLHIFLGNQVRYDGETSFCCLQGHKNKLSLFVSLRGSCFFLLHELTRVFPSI